jgi:pyruvate dehydrogenase E2 component (dihydrolipoamide acetyltransferase)
MATEIVMPRQGNTVESCIILSWKKKEGDSVSIGESICEVETDKATFDVESTADGVVLKILCSEGDDIPVLTPIALIGYEGEQVQEQSVKASHTNSPHVPINTTSVTADTKATTGNPTFIQSTQAVTSSKTTISPRAKNRALASGIDVSKTQGTGPGGRIIERDIDRHLQEHEPLTPAAMDRLQKSALSAPQSGSGIGGRILSSDLVTRQAPGDGLLPDIFEEIPVKGVRKRISDKMLSSLQTTAQLTMNSSANVVQLLELRNCLKEIADRTNQTASSINDLVLFGVARSITGFHEVNAHFFNDRIIHFSSVNLGFAVDTPRGLMVPVIRNADTRSLQDITQETRRLAKACNEGTILPDELKGATFTVTNLGALGIEHFTPVLNPPEVCILGICAIQAKPVMTDNKVDFIPHLGLSLTFNHQALDGAPAARFLQHVASTIATIKLLIP